MGLNGESKKMGIMYSFVFLSNGGEFIGFHFKKQTQGAYTLRP